LLQNFDGVDMEHCEADMEHLVDTLPVKYKEKICRDFVKCSRLIDCLKVRQPVTKCFRLREYEPRDFLEKLTRSLTKEEKIFLCDKTKECNVKRRGNDHTSCSFSSASFCSAWFSHLSELDFTEKPKKVKITKTELDGIDKKIQDISDRWNIQVK